MSKNKFKNDKYKKSRGGYSRLLDITCSVCGKHVCFYQKDGPGVIKRMYLDRVVGSKYANLQNSSIENLPSFNCTSCHRNLGHAIVYKKENRLAYRIFVGAINKKIVKSKLVDQ